MDHIVRVDDFFDGLEVHVEECHCQRTATDFERVVGVLDDGEKVFDDVEVGFAGLVVDGEVQDTVEEFLVGVGEDRVSFEVGVVRV